jgi:hypothetical protein
MSGVSNNYSSSTDYSSLFSSLSSSSTGLDLTDYAAIKNGSYGKLMKAYYKNQEASKTSESGDSKQTLTLMKSNAEALQNSAAALMDESLWEKKLVKKTDETTGEVTEEEDYDWDAITKAVKNFVSDYNTVIGKAADSDTRDILRSAARMTSVSSEMSTLLNQVGITIGSENKLEVDEDKLKSASVGTLKTLFTGSHSYADKMSQKSAAIVRATSGTSNTYTVNATYSSTLSTLVSGKIDEEV